jgi:hypothetical protein
MRRCFAGESAAPHSPILEPLDITRRRSSASASRTALSVAPVERLDASPDWLVGVAVDVLKQPTEHQPRR